MKRPDQVDRRQGTVLCLLFLFLFLTHSATLKNHRTVVLLYKNTLRALLFIFFLFARRKRGNMAYKVHKLFIFR